MEQVGPEQARHAPYQAETAPAVKVVRVVCLADTHDLQGQFRIDVPDGDILVHAGDLTNGGTFLELARSLGWLGTLPHRHKIVVAGNHDLLFESDPTLAKSLVDCAGGIVYLLDREIEVEGLRIYGSPWTPRFYGAFNLDRGEPLSRAWSRIPKGLDVLVTHGPPLGVFDLTSDDEHAGCEDLLWRVREARPGYHVFGHIHEHNGEYEDEETGVTFMNVSVANERLDRVRPARVITLWPM